MPLNNRLQAVDLKALDPAGLKSERDVFEPRWIFWNRFRTLFGVVATALLLWVAA